MCSYEFCVIFKKIFFIKHLRWLKFVTRAFLPTIFTYSVLNSSSFIKKLFFKLKVDNISQMIFVSRFQDNSPLGKLPPPPENCCLTIKFPSKIIASTQANLPPKITTSELRKTMYYLTSTII